MNSGIAFLLALGIGIVAGLRSMTAPAAVAWAAHLGWINLSGSHLAFIGSAWAVGIFTLGALVEFVTDQLPTTPARTTVIPLAAAYTGVTSGYPTSLSDTSSTVTSHPVRRRADSSESAGQP